MSFHNESKRSPSPFTMGDSSDDEKQQSQGQQQKPPASSLLSPNPIQAANEISSLRHPQLNVPATANFKERRSSGRRDSYLVVHDNLLMQQPQAPFPVSAETSEENEKYSSEIEEIRSAIETPIQRLNNSKSLQLDSDALAELVVSVRDLSKSLMGFSMKLKMKNIMVISKLMDPEVVDNTRDLALWLIKHDKLNVYVEDTLAKHPNFGYDSLSSVDGLDRLKFWSSKACASHPNKFDFVITLGGDGTVLYTSWLFQKVVPPVLCFSMGSLGFLTDFDYKLKEDILEDVIKNGVMCSLRMRFECTIMKSKSHHKKGQFDLAEEILDAEQDGLFKNHYEGESYCILNDVVVDRGPNPTMTTTELYGNFSLLTSIEADGCVISTPSGSTAYSLSAGGSLVHPDIPGILVSPVCPHTLSFRPLVVPDSVIVRIGVPYDARVSAWCSFDGRARVELQRGDFLTVVASRYPFPKVQHSKLATEQWFHRLSKTLHWNQRSRQKAIPKLSQ